MAQASLYKLIGCLAFLCCANSALLAQQNADNLSGKSGFVAKEPRYSMVVLHNGTELKGYVEVLESGIIVVRGNRLINKKIEISPERVRSIRYLKTMVVKLRSGKRALGYLLRETSEDYYLETIIEPRRVMVVNKKEIQQLKDVPKVNVFRHSKSLLYFSAGFTNTLQGFNGFIKNGFQVVVGFNQELQYILNTGRWYVPDFRAEFAFTNLSSDRFSFRSFSLNAGPTYLLPIYKPQWGYFVFALLPGASHETITGDLFSESAIAFSTTALVGYEYAFKEFSFHVHLRLHNSHDVNESFIGFTPAIGFSFLL